MFSFSNEKFIIFQKETAHHTRQADRYTVASRGGKYTSIFYHSSMICSLSFYSSAPSHS